MKTIGEVIQGLRLKRDLTQEELAVKANVSYTSLVKIERDQVKNPTINTLKKLADALEVSVDEILSLTGNSNNDKALSGGRDVDTN